MNDRLSKCCIDEQCMNSTCTAEFTKAELLKKEKTGVNSDASFLHNRMENILILPAVLYCLSLGYT